MIARLALVILLGGASTLLAQAVPTAERAGDAQIGAAFTSATPDYGEQRFNGFGIYADFDFRAHIGVEAEFHKVFSTNGNKASQRTAEIGGRYFRSYGPLVPYAKGMYGRGSFTYPFALTERGYNMFAAGAGADLRVTQFIHVRGEYEYQKWISFPNHGLTPQLITVGVAYHFAGKPRYKPR